MGGMSESTSSTKDAPVLRKNKDDTSRGGKARCNRDELNKYAGSWMVLGERKLDHALLLCLRGRLRDRYQYQEKEGNHFVRRLVVVREFVKKKGGRDSGHQVRRAEIGQSKS
jgi:hypothetical protein